MYSGGSRARRKPQQYRKYSEDWQQDHGPKACFNVPNRVELTLGWMPLEGVQPVSFNFKIQSKYFSYADVNLLLRRRFHGLKNKSMLLWHDESSWKIDKYR